LSTVKRLLGILAVLTAVVGGLIVAPASPAYAYSGGGAAYYAEQWWNSHNTNYAIINDDCTNFVSQALHSGGGFSYVGGTSSTDDYQWWMHYSSWTGFSWSRSFTFADDLYKFLMWHYPGGWYEGSARSSVEQNATYTPDSVVTGDVLFYDWDSNGTKDHVGIQVGWGSDPISGWYGNYQDQHSNNRHHAFWSLLPYNSQWQTTTVTFVHVDSRNG
jgi:hypothetical protein